MFGSCRDPIRHRIVNTRTVAFIPVFLSQNCSNPRKSVKREGRLPERSARAHAREWSERLLGRARELEAAGVIQRGEPGRFVLAENWRQRLERLRAVELTKVRESGRQHDTGLER